MQQRDLRHSTPRQQHSDDKTGKNVLFAILTGILLATFPPLGLLVAVAGLFRSKGKKKDGETEDRGALKPDRQRREKKLIPPTASHTARPSFSFREDDHQHIVPTGLSVEKRLEQLKVLLDAGLYTKEEYRAAKARVLQQR